jgi:HPt (histidine-containing phosphotransfer) domain-containing protein
MGNAFDRQAVLDRFGGDRELLQQIADLFRGSVAAWLSEMREACAAGDLPRVKRTAHTLKGSLGNFLAKDAADAAYQVQQCAAANDAAALSPAVARLEDAVEAVLAALDEMLPPGRKGENA